MSIKTKELKYRLICLFTFLILPFVLMSYENKEFDDFFDSQAERDRKKIQKKEASIKQVSEKYVVIFFYVGNQEASHDAARYVQSLAVKYNWQTYAISLNGIFIDGFENNRINNGIYETFQENSNAPYRNFEGPGLFLFNPQNNDIYWIITGSSDFNILEDLIYTKYRYFGL